MTTEEIHSALIEKVEKSWGIYQTQMLQLPAQILFTKADEIAAARFCCNELTDNLPAYPDHMLEHLLQFENPLEIMREEWMDVQCVEHSMEFEHALWSLWDHGPVAELEDEPQMGGMTQI